MQKDEMIYKRVAINTVDEMPIMKDNNGMEFVEKSLVKTRIGLLPSAQPEHNPDDERKIADLHKMVNYLLSQLEQRWIPVTEKEKLPEDEYVIISKKPSPLSGSKWCVDKAIRMTDPRSRKIQWRDCGFGVIQDDKVLAWMPLPEPYKEER